MKKKLEFLDLFAGVGGFRLGMEQAGHTCVGYVEWDKFARKSYEAIHDTKGEWTAHDITSVSDDAIRELRSRGQIEVICGGFPCQAFSIAGKRKGFEDTRGTLFFEIARFANIVRPRYLFLENVKGLLNHDGGDTFETILRTLDELGYDAEWDLLNSKDFGVPQNRERVFIIGHLRGASTRKVFPVGTGSEEVDVSNITTGTLTALYPVSQREGTYIEEVRNRKREIEVVGKLDIKGDDYIKRVYSPKGISPALPAMQGGSQEPKIIQAVLTPDREEKRQDGRRIKEPGEPMFTLTSQDRHGVLVSQKTGVRGTERANTIDANYFKGLGNNQERAGVQEGYRIRKLTPRECWRLQGFPDWAFDKAQAVNSDSQLYKQAGNSVTVNVIYEIAKRL